MNNPTRLRDHDALESVDVRSEIADARAALVRGKATDTQLALVYMANRMGAAYGEAESLSGRIRVESAELRRLLAMGLEKRVAGQ